MRKLSEIFGNNIPANVDPAAPPATERTAAKFGLQGDECPTCGAEPGTPGYLRLDVGPDDPRFGKPVPCPDCHGVIVASKHRQRSQLDGWLEQATFDSFEERPELAEALEAARRFASRRVGWLTISGDYGNGKSHLLASIVNHCLEQRIAAEYWTLPDLLDGLRQGYQDGDYSPLFERLRALPVLCVDEFDKARINAWAGEKIYQLVDARYRSLDEKGTVFAANSLRFTTDSDAVSVRYILSRMFDSRCEIVNVRSRDFRPRAGRGQGGAL